MADSLEDITCENCIALCCRAPVNMALSPREYERNRGTMDLRLIVTAKPYKQRIQLEIEGVDGNGEPHQNITLEAAKGYGLYELQTGCGNLTETNSCSIYDQRPSCCRAFELRSPACLAVRRQAGLDTDGPVLESDFRVTQRPRSATEKLLAQHFPTYASDPENVAAPSEAEQLVGSVRAAPLDISAARTLIKRESRWLANKLADLSGPQWQLPTRCPDWNVQSVAAHIVTSQRFVHEILTAAVDGRDIVDAEPFEGDPATTIAAFTTAMSQLGDVLGTFTPDDFVATVSVGESAATVRHLVHVLALELTVHGSDIAAALGEPRRLNSDALQAIATVLPRLLDEGEAPRDGEAYVLRSDAFELPLTWRDGAWNLEPGIDPCWIEGIAEAVLLFALGRQSFETSQLVTNDIDRANNFKRYLPGP